MASAAAAAPEAANKGAATPAAGAEDDGPCMFENIAELKERYKEDFATLRAQLTLPCEDDLICYRFLRGHKFVQARAAEALNTMLAWRAEHGLDELRKKAEKLTQKQFPFAEKVLAVHPHNIVHGFDRKGQPLSIERLGHANPYLMVRTIKFEEMLQYHFYHMEAKASLVASMSLEKGVLLRTAKVMDLSGMGKQHLDRRGLVFFKKLVDMSQHSYPEMLGDLYIVNTPWIFSLGWKIVKPWLNEKTLAKIHILPNDKFKEMLREKIPEEHLPEFLGGSCTCAALGGCVPLRDPDAGFTTTQIGGRSKFEHVITITQEEIDRLRKAEAAAASEAGVAATPCLKIDLDAIAPASSDAAAAASPAAASSSSSSSASSPCAEVSALDGSVGPGRFLGLTVRYEFRTVKNDIAFEIRAQHLDAQAVGSPVVMTPEQQDSSSASFPSAAVAAAAAPAATPVPVSADGWHLVKASKRYQSDADTVSGSFLLTHPSVLQFRFDNSFSMFTGKTLLWRIEVDTAIEHPADATEAQVKKQFHALGKHESREEEVFSPMPPTEEEQ